MQMAEVDGKDACNEDAGMRKEAKRIYILPLKQNVII